MDESRTARIQFLQKEIKTYAALSLFLSRKRGIKVDLLLGAEKKRPVSHPSTRANERSKKLTAHELRSKK